MILARADQASRRYGDVLALDRVDLEVRAGELVGLLGPNGAGKSTLMNLLVGLRRPSSGRVELFGGDPRDPASRRQIGVTPQETGLPGTLRVGEVVDFVSAHYPDPVPRAELLDRFGLADLARRQTGGLSGGQRRRLAVALAFVGRPRLVLLDEPTTGLDVAARHTLWDGDPGIPRRRRHRAVEQPLPGGGGGARPPGGGHRAGPGARRRHAWTRCAASSAYAGSAWSPTTCPTCPGWSAPNGSTVGLHLLTTDADELVRALVTAQTPFTDLEVRPTSLEEAFLAITSGDAPSGDAAAAQPAPADPPPPLPAADPPASEEATVQLALVHARYQLLEIIRIPVAVVGSAFFPAAAMIFFVVPFAGDDPVGATYATASMVTFSVMSANIFQYGVGVAEDRDQPWNPYTRTLPAGPAPAVRRPGAGRPGADLPLADPGRGHRRDADRGPRSPRRRSCWPLGTVAVISVPFTLMGLAIGYSLPSKAAIVVAQVLFLPLAFGGGLLSAPGDAPGFIETIAPYLPTRGAAELMWAAVGDYDVRAAGTDHARCLGGAARRARRLGVPAGRGSPVQLTIRPFPPRAAAGRCQDSGRGPPWPPGPRGVLT